MNNHSQNVPTIVLVVLALLCFVLSMAGFLFKIWFGTPWQALIVQIVLTVGFFVVGVPLLTYLTSIGINKANGENIAPKNAVALGLLLSVVSLIWLMGAYS